jgi:hypothetical protein
LPTYGTIIYLWANPSLGLGPDALRIKAVIFFNSFVMPAVAIAMMKALGFISSLEMKDKQERIIPFIATMIFYIWTFMAVKNALELPAIMVIFILGTVVSLMASFFINLWHKLSIHMVGMGGLLTACILMMLTSEKSMGAVLPGVIVLAGLTATARLYLKAHTPIELYTGFLVGVSGQMMGMLLHSKFIV